MAPSTEAAQAVIETLGDRREPPLLASWVGDGATEPARRLFAEHRIPSYATPGQAVRAFMYGDVLQENTVMRKLCQRFGFIEARVPEDRNIVRVSLKL